MFRINSYALNRDQVGKLKKKFKSNTVNYHVFDSIMPTKFHYFKLLVFCVKSTTIGSLFTKNFSGTYIQKVLFLIFTSSK